jgi:hypothetical protein
MSQPFPRSAALVTDAAFIEFHHLKMPLQISPAKEFRRRVVTVSPPFTDCALHHPFARARIPQVPFGIMLLILHIRLGRVSQTTLLPIRRASA